MKRIGLTLITLSFLAGAYLAVLDPETLAWTPFLIIVAFGFVGVYLARAGDKAVATSSETVAANTRQLRSSIDAVIAEVTRLETEKADMDVYDLPTAIDSRVLEHLDTFAANRDTMKHAYGLQPFADVMSHFAGGERYLNRVWSSSVDGYIDEAHAYITRSLEQFRLASQRLGEAERSA